MNLVVVNKISELREKVKNFKKEGKSVGLVPTMGCLHEGHASLIRTSASKCDVTVVSVFVNPVQFGPNEDYDKYPRTLDSDRELAEKNGAAIIFAPSVAEMYPGMQKFSDITMVAPPFGLVDMMCGKSRTGHFDGVCTVVSKLFNIVQPDLENFRKHTRPRRYDLYDVFNAILYSLTTGCQWRELPHDFPEWHTVYRYYDMWRDKPDPTADSLLERLLKKLLLLIALHRDDRPERRL